MYSRLIEAGEKYGMKHVGYYATRALRIEKFYAFWGQDLDTRTTPLECGRMWRVKFDVNITQFCMVFLRSKIFFSRKIL